MKSPIELRHDHFRQLYFAERARREAIRGSIGPPVAAFAFAVFAFSSLATEFNFRLWQQTISIAIMVLACGSVAALLAAVYHVVKVEWLFVYHEPPGLDDLLAAEDRIQADRPDEAERQMTELLTASYFIAYQQYLTGNAASARSRTWALRLVLAALLLLAAAFLLLPLHLAN